MAFAQEMDVAKVTAAGTRASSSRSNLFLTAGKNRLSTVQNAANIAKINVLDLNQGIVQISAKIRQI